MSTAGAAALCKRDFNVTVSVRNVTANLYIVEADKMKLVRWEEPFTINFFYRLGRPKVTNSPFRVHVVATEMGMGLPTIDEVRPAAPDVNSTTDPEEYLMGEVRCTAPERPEESEIDYPCYVFNISMFQQDHDLGDADTDIEVISGPNAAVPNIRSSIADDAELYWDTPLDDQGNPVDVELEVVVTSSTGEEWDVPWYVYQSDTNTYVLNYDALAAIAPDIEIDEEVEAEVKLRRADTPEEEFSKVFRFPLRYPEPTIALFEATAIGNNSIRLRFRPTPSTDALTQWDYRYRLTGATVIWDLTDWIVHSVNGNNTEQEITITGLLEGASYDIQLRCLTYIGHYSDTLTRTVVVT